MSDRPIQLLLVDDNPNYVGVLEHQFSSFPGKFFRITWKNDSQQAIAHLQTGAPTDLIIMDYYLPGTNGIEVIKKINDAGFVLPVILLTSQKDYRIAIEAMKFGIEEYLIKEELTDTVLPRTILTTIDRFQLRQRMKEIEKDALFSEQTTKSIQALVVTICHEFNNPLAAIKISSDILSRQATSPEERALLSELNRNIVTLEQNIIKLRDLNSGKQS